MERQNLRAAWVAVGLGALAMILRFREVARLGGLNVTGIGLFLVLVGIVSAGAGLFFSSRTALPAGPEAEN